MLERDFRLALVHHPVLDRKGDTVTTAITNLDLHDISRSAHTYGIERYYIVHPIAAQRELATRVRTHWVEGAGGKRIPDRVPALRTLTMVSSLDEMCLDCGADVEIWTTSARQQPGVLSFAAAREQLATPGSPVVLCLGTGWGLAPEVEARASRRLAPVESPRADGYNHLSVRAAAAIMLDRLLAPR